VLRDPKKNSRRPKKALFPQGGKGRKEVVRNHLWCGSTDRDTWKGGVGREGKFDLRLRTTNHRGRGTRGKGDLHRKES